MKGKYMSEMNEAEVIKRMIDGFKLASSCAKALGVMRRNTDFQGIGLMIDELGKNAARLAVAKAMPEYLVQESLKKRERILSTN